MTERKTAFMFRLKHFFTYHPWLKAIALLLAVVLWLYVKGEIIRASL